MIREGSILAEFAGEGQTAGGTGFDYFCLQPSVLNLLSKGAVEMAINWFMARQYANPQGLFGRLFMARKLNQTNLPGNGLVFDLMSVEPANEVLEVGFGGGGLLFRFAKGAMNGRVAGVEFSQSMFDSVRKRVLSQKLSARIELHMGSVDALPFEDNRFDCACSVNTLYFWPDLASGLVELSRVIKPGGRLVLGFGSDTDMHEAGYHKRGFSLYAAQEIETALDAAGLEPYALERLDQARGAFLASASRKRV